LTAEKVSNPER